MKAVIALAVLTFLGLCLVAADARAFEQQLERQGWRVDPLDAGVVPMEVLRCAP